MENQKKKKFAEAIDGEIEKLVDYSVQRSTQNLQNIQEQSPSVRLEKLVGRL